MLKKYRLILPASLILLLSACGGGGGSNPSRHTTSTPQDMSQSSACNASHLCTTTFTWNQPDFHINNDFKTTITIYTATSGAKVGSHTWPETSSQQNQETFPSQLKEGVSYQAKYYSTSISGQSQTDTLTFTPEATNIAYAPTNIIATPVCSSQHSCTVSLSWNQPHYISGYITQVSIKATSAGATPIYNQPHTDTGATNNQLSNISVTEGTTYIATLYSYTNASNHSHSVESRPFTPSLLRGAGLFIYDEGYDLTGTSNALSSAHWLAGPIAQGGFTYLYPDILYVSAIPSSNYNNFNTYYQDTVQATCSSEPTDPGLGYTASANQTSPSAKTCANGTAITSAYSDHGKYHVMPILEFQDSAGNALSSASSTQISYLAQAVAKIISEDPNAAGVIVDHETVPKAGSTASHNWFQFYSDVQTALRTDANGGTPKLLAINGDKGLFSAIENANGETLWQLMNTQHCDKRCFIVLSQYDITPTGSSLGRLQFYTDRIASGNSTDPHSTVGMAVSNNTPFQFGINASASENNWGSANVYGSFDNSMIGNSNIQTSQSCGTYCTFAQQTISTHNNTVNVTAPDYTCSALSTFNALLFTTPPSTLGCTPKAQPKVTPSPYPNMAAYFMGVAAYRLGSDAPQSTTCTTVQQNYTPGSNTFCILRTANNVTEDPSALSFIQQFMSETW